MTDLDETSRLLSGTIKAHRGYIERREFEESKFYEQDDKIVMLFIGITQKF